MAAMLVARGLMANKIYINFLRRIFEFPKSSWQSTWPLWWHVQTGNICVLMHPRFNTPYRSISYPESFGLEQKAWRLWCKIASYSPPNASFWYGKKNTNHSSTHVTWISLMYSYLIWKNGTKLFSVNCIIRCFQNTHQISSYSKIYTIFISLYSQYCPKLILFR